MIFCPRYTHTPTILRGKLGERSTSIFIQLQTRLCSKRGAPPRRILEIALIRLLATHLWAPLKSQRDCFIVHGKKFQIANSSHSSGKRFRPSTLLPPFVRYTKFMNNLEELRRDRICRIVTLACANSPLPFSHSHQFSQF